MALDPVLEDAVRALKRARKDLADAQAVLILKEQAARDARDAAENAKGAVVAARAAVDALLDDPVPPNPTIPPEEQP